MDSRWFEYDWRYEDEDAVFGVEMAYAAADDVRGKNSELLIVTIEGKQGFIKESQWRKCEAIKNKINRNYTVEYGGFIKSAKNARYYFYAPNRSIVSSLEVFLSKYDFMSCDTISDGRWKYYFKLLYPTTAKLQTEENAKTIELYRRMGDALSLPRKITLHMYFPSESLRILFEEQARLSGFAIGDSEFSMEYENPHGVRIHKIAPLLKRDVDEMTTRALHIAGKYEGNLLFWEAATIKTPKRK